MKKAFTLAETLITLAIIGIVASLTIPSVIVKYQKEQTVINLKKTYNMLTNATNMSVIDNGPIDNWNFSQSSSSFTEKYLLPYLKVRKLCLDSVGNKNKYSPCTGVDRRTLNTEFYKTFADIATLNDGQIIYFGKYISSDNYGKTLMMIVDINGDKKPNKMGRDAFAFIINGNNGGYDSMNAFINKAGLNFMNHGACYGCGPTTRNVLINSNYGCKNDGYAYMRN